jgi:hypothetical protein
VGWVIDNNGEPQLCSDTELWGIWEREVVEKSKTQQDEQATT